MGNIKVGIAGRKENSLAHKTAQQAIGLLLQKNASIELDSAFFKQKGVLSKPLSKFNSDVVLSFGGDGTLLQVFRDLKRKTPVVGVNCGMRGFLQSFKSAEVEQAVDAVVEGKFNVEKRTRILAKIDGKRVGEAVNEVLIVPQKAGRLLRYSLRTGKEHRKESGDGLIVATPTGSTAHALSAGGPIVKGNAAVFVVVSMNPVDWQHRPLIINDHEKVMVEGFEKAKPELIIDGQMRFKIKKKAELVKGSEVLLAVRER